MVEFHSNSFVRQVTTLTLIVRPNPYSGAPFNQCLIEYVSSSIHHYTIWSDKCYLLVHIIVEIHLVGNLDGLSPSPSATSSSPWFNDELLFQEPTPIVHFPRILKCHFIYLCCTFYSRTSWVWGIITPIGSESRSDMMVGTTFQELCCWPFDDLVIGCHA